TIGDRPVVYVAHSMGGLILKYWLKHYYASQACAPGESETPNKWLKIKKIIFAGTPHYGSPKAIRAFGEGFHLLDTESYGILATLVGYFDDRTLSYALNKFGHTFPSAYQLLPIINSKCFPHQWEPFIEVKPAYSPPHLRIDLFESDTWNYLRWPRRIGDD